MEQKLEYVKDNFVVSTDKSKLDVEATHDFLTNSYWSKGVTFEKVKRSIQNCLTYGVYDCGKQIGFARVTTDYTYFAYIADLYIIEDYRGQGLSKWLMECILANPELQNLRSWMLATKDAHGLYEKYGFKKLEDPSRYMKRSE